MKTQALTQQAKPRRYPWRQWFIWKRFTIRSGRDYDCRSYVMAQMVRNRARLVGLRVSIAIHPDDAGLTVVVRHLPQRGERRSNSKDHAS